MHGTLRSWFFVGVFFVLAAMLVDAQETKSKGPNYYPLQVGNKWHYRVETGGFTGKAVAPVAAIETIDGKALARVDFSADGKVIATEHLSQTDKGVFRHLNDKVALKPATMLLQYPAKADEKWKGDFTADEKK